MKGRMFIITAFVILMSASATWAGVPEILNYQGYLTDGADEPLQGSYSIVFTIYDDPILGDPGNIKWQETHASVLVSGGFFTVALGSNGFPLSEEVFSGPYRYLGIKIGEDSEITPRTQLTSMAYTFRSETADSAGTVADDCITSEKIASGEVENDDINSDAVTTDKIEDMTILLEDIGDNGAADGDVMKWSDASSSWEVGGVQSSPVIWSGGCTSHGRGTGWMTYCSDGVDFNSTAGYLTTTGNGVFTVQTAGYYRINFCTIWQGTSYYYARIIKNSSSFHYLMETGDGNWHFVSLDITLYFSVGDQFYVECNESSGTGYAWHSWTAFNSLSRLQVTYIGPPAP